jgi:hypothetical protein
MKDQRFKKKAKQKIARQMKYHHFSIIRLWRAVNRGWMLRVEFPSLVANEYQD